MAKIKPYEHGKSPVPKSWAETAAYLKAGRDARKPKSNTLVETINRLMERMADMKGSDHAT